MNNAKANATTATDISNLIITYANEITDRKSSLTPIKLQKILYYVYVDCLVMHGVKLFNTPIEKWKFGPVVSSVYHNFKTYGVRHISEPTSSFIFDESDGEFYFEEIPFSSESIDLCPKIRGVIKQKVIDLIDVNPFVLVDKTHGEKPWRDFEAKILNGERGFVYSDEELISYFSGKAEY